LSYFLYLMHMPILMCILAIQGLRGPTQLLLALSLSVIAAWLSWRFLEGPLIAFGKRASYGETAVPDALSNAPSRVTG
jgi:peptidoglycan/LPS O-acetylase OafA/YrhL